ncbi:MAG TPA: tetratricopeptide repeat protein [Candidatus Margulisiibacteriota bacterium]|nr:tetratricopeptide repeat protein [Candidatus Margulisiibacteriota bacterium]
MILNKIDKKVIYTVSFSLLLAAALFLSVRLAMELKKTGSNFSQANKEKVELKSEYDKIKNDFAKLRNDYDALNLERNNTFSRAKELLAENQHLKELNTALEDTKENNKKDMQLLEKVKEEGLEQNLALKEQIKDLLLLQKQLIKEKTQVEESLKKAIEKSGMKKLEDENSSLKTANRNLEVAFKQKEVEAAKLKDSESKSKEEALLLGNRVNELAKNYAEAVKKNKDLEERVMHLPSKFAEVARQNKVLIKRTANMHYNLGVFYTHQKEYARATAEFEKAVELTPDDAYSHFNLGYIYAEYLVNRPKAIEHFREYLRNVRKDDKDADWVKKYIITWESMDGKQPME